jgi:hypothetical protein
MTNPLFEAIERLTNPYAMQERVYRNRVDSQDASRAPTWPCHTDASFRFPIDRVTRQHERRNTKGTL